MSDLTTEATTEEKPAWSAQLPDEYKNDPDLTSHAKLGDLAKDYKGLKAKAARSVEIPGEYATDEQRSTFFNRLGRPEKAEDYEFEANELPDGMVFNPDLVEGFKSEAYKHGLSKKQAAKLYNWYIEASKGLYTMHQGTLKQETDKADKALKEEWGGEYKANATLAERAAKHYGFEDFNRMSNANKKALLKIAQAVGEATFISGKTADTSGGMNYNTIYPSMKDLPDRRD